jgi:hypothetical protein
MQTFRGRMVSHQGGEPFVAVVTVDDEWVRIVSGHRRLGAWTRDALNTQRVTVFRFQMDLDGAPHTFTPDDPATFSEAVGAVVDLRPKSRFGLGDRVREALAEREEAVTAKAAEDSLG